MLSRLRSVLTTAGDPPSPLPEPLDALRKLLTTNPPPSPPPSFLSDTTLLRYLKARSNNPQKAHTMLLATLQWRASYHPATLFSLHTDALRNAAESGKMYVLPKPDKNGRAIIIMRPGLENSRDAVNNVRFLVYTLERASNLSDLRGDAKYVVLVDFFTGVASVSNSPSFGVMRETTGILQNHYPERLGAMLLFEAPSFFVALFRMIRPFVDSGTRDKIFFVKRNEPFPETDLLDPYALPKEYGGRAENKFDAEEYLLSEEVSGE